LKTASPPFPLRCCWIPRPACRPPARLEATALKLLGDCGRSDSVAIYTFSDSVTALQPFTAIRMRRRAPCCEPGVRKTALYDALTRVSREIAEAPQESDRRIYRRRDNLSALTSETALRRAKTLASPFTPSRKETRDRTAGHSQTTGELHMPRRSAFTIHSPPRLRRFLRPLPRI